MALIDALPPVRGSYRQQAPLAPMTWLRVGGPAAVLFKPSDIEDLQDFMRGCPPEVPLLPLGLASNLLVRDGGFPGVVIRLGRAFAGCEIVDGVPPLKGGVDAVFIRAGAGAPGRNVALWCLEQGLAGPEFLSGIPGTVGGAVAMNAGAYGQEVADILEAVELVTRQGERLSLKPDALSLAYRQCRLPEGAIVVSAVFRCKRAERGTIRQRIDAIAEAREQSQPLRTRTGGSTFKNPPDNKAWELIDKAGCRGLQVGGAQMSEKHCNFMLNTGDATAAELEQLGEEVRRRVQEASGVELQWEIRRVGGG